VPGRKGCLVGCGLVLGLVLLYPLYLLVAGIFIPLVLGFLFPWEPPRAEDAPREAVLRVLAPEGEPYDIQWGSGFSKENQEGEMVDPNLGYRDYPVRDQAKTYDSSGFEIVIEASGGRPGGYREEVSLGAVLFVEGEYAYCRGDQGEIFLNWRPGQGNSAPITRMLCGSHRYVPL
jgi:hypothetical protein